ncbi:MAG: VOC family protein [Patescibacteria group bacterium]
MARTSIYLNFTGTTEEAFHFYKKAFGTEFTGQFQRIGEVPASPDMPVLSDAEKNMIMHIELPILGGLILMGTDAIESMGQKLTFGNNISINLEPDTREETDRLFAALSEGGKIGMPLQEMFWGGYFGSCTDKYGVLWMFNCAQ